MSKSINSCDIKVSMLFNLLLASITILLCFFFFFLVAFNNSCFFPVAKENIKVKLALANPAGIPITLVKEIILIHLLVAVKQIKPCQYNQKQLSIYLAYYSLSFFLGFLN